VDITDWKEEMDWL